MIKKSLKYFAIILLFSFIGCERFDDTILIVKVISSSDSSAINNVRVDVAKRKPAMFWGYKTVDTYDGYTNNQGICKIRIDNYNRDKYDYSIDVYPYSDYGGYTYSVWGTVIEEYELKETLKVSLTRIPKI